MNIGKSFSFIFEDPRWLTKVLIGTAVLIISSLLAPILIGILGFFIVTGYGLEVVRNVRRGDQYPMPEWRDRWGEWLVLGVKLAVVVIIWSLPIILFSLPLALGGALSDQSGGEVIGSLIVACFGCLVFVWAIVILLATPAIYIRLAETERISSGLQFGEILAFSRQNIGDVIIASIMYVVASFVVGLAGAIVGTLLCLVGLLVTVPAAQLITILIQSHLYAQVGLHPKPWQQSVVPAEYIPEPPPAPPAVAVEESQPPAPSENTPE